MFPVAILLGIYTFFPGAKSQDWIDSFNVFSDAKRAFFKASNMSLLGAYAYPQAGPEAFLACSDWLNVILLVDDYCDEQDGAQSREISDAFLDGLKGNPRDGSVFSAIGAEYVFSCSLSCFGCRHSSLCLTHFSPFVTPPLLNYIHCSVPLLTSLRAQFPGTAFFILD